MEYEFTRVAEIEAREIPYWIPDTEFDSDGPRYRRDALAGRGVRKISDLYTKRNLWAISKLLDEFNRCLMPRIRDALKFALTATLVRSAKTTRYMMGKSGNAPMSGSFYLATMNTENNILKLYERKFKSCLDAFRLICADQLSNEAYVVKCSASRLNGNLASSIDYIFTDPPFGSSIYYSEVNLPWEAWIGETTDIENEAVVHREQDGGTKRLPDYARLMTEAFCEMYRVLKPGRWASVVFHNSDDRIWQIILDSAEAAGFELAQVNTFDKVQMTFMGIRGESGEYPVTNKDIVLNLHKPAPLAVARQNGHNDRLEIEQRIVERVADFLATSPPEGQRTLQHLWNHVLFDMLRNGSVEVGMAGVEEMLKHHYQTFKLVDGRYYLRGESVIGGNVFDLGSDVGAITWLTSLLSNEARTTGDLIPLWQQETAHLGGAAPRRLENLLEQNFWQDRRSGRWRLPTAAEREKMSAREDLSAHAHLRVVQRFLEGKLDYRPGDIELAAWVRFCYHREFFSEATDLFQHINQSVLEPEEYKVVKRMAAVSRMRARPAEG